MRQAARRQDAGHIAGQRPQAARAFRVTLRAADGRTLAVLRVLADGIGEAAQAARRLAHGCEGAHALDVLDLDALGRPATVPAEARP